MAPVEVPDSDVAILDVTADITDLGLMIRLAQQAFGTDDSLRLKMKPARGFPGSAEISYACSMLSAWEFEFGMFSKGLPTDPSIEDTPMTMTASVTLPPSDDQLDLSGVMSGVTKDRMTGIDLGWEDFAMTVEVDGLESIVLSLDAFDTRDNLVNPLATNFQASGSVSYTHLTLPTKA